MNRGDEILAAFSAALTELRRLGHGPYARHDVSRIIDPLGSRVETFLRVVALPGSSRRDKFYDLIEGLRPAGMRSMQVDQLHGLRTLYNRSKHEPSTLLPLAEATDAVRGASAAMAALVALGIGAVTAPFERELNYHLWVGFWDHYTGGATEVAVMLPSDHWTHVGAVDTLHMDISTWDTLKPMLQAHPRFRLGESHFEPDVWRSFRDGEDFLNAGVWDGEYSELIRLLAPLEDRSISEKLFPWLTREANSTSVGTSLIMAAVDVARAAPVPMAKECLAEAIKKRADSEYAMPRKGPGVAEAAVQIAALISLIPFGEWRRLVGPALSLRRGEGMSNTVPGPLHLELDGNTLVLGFDDRISITVHKFKSDD